MNANGAAYLAVADRIGLRLCRDAVWAGNRCNWLGWALERRRQFWLPVYRSQGSGLYDGTAGIALFLAELVRHSGDPLQRATLYGALEQVARATEEPDGERAFGFHRGCAGIASALVRAGEILGDERWIDRGERLLTWLGNVEPDTARSDVATGSAGTVLGLLEAATALGRDDFVAIARVHGDALMQTAVRSEAGWAWTAGGVENHAADRCGYAHGNAGIAVALLALAEATDDPTYREAAMDALRFERRPSRPPRHEIAANGAATLSKDGPHHGIGWCEGETAVGFSRLQLCTLLTGDARVAVMRELDHALQATETALSRPFGLGRGFCLCHGAAGLADLLIESSGILKRPALLQVAEMVGNTGIAHFHEPENPWPSGVPVRGESPNLLLGLAGIGIFYLRLHAPHVTPSVLIVGAGAYGIQRQVEGRAKDGGKAANTSQTITVDEIYGGGQHA
jgi:lantibiotic modifying enzyme